MMRRKRQQDEVTFQLTPMIDMTFLLLIFFMVTSKLSDEKVKKEINLPFTRIGVVPDTVGDRDIINIDANGDYFISQRRVDKQELASYLKSRFEAQPPLKIQLRADAKTPGKITNEFIKIASEAGAATILIGAVESKK